MQRSGIRGTRRSTVGWGKRSEPQHSHPSHAHTAIAGGALLGNRLVAGHARAKGKKGLRAGQRWASAYHRETMAEPGLVSDTVGIARKRFGAETRPRHYSLSLYVAIRGSMRSTRTRRRRWAAELFRAGHHSKLLQTASEN
jgi:hypothetical protein